MRWSIGVQESGSRGDYEPIAELVLPVKFGGCGVLGRRASEKRRGRRMRPIVVPVLWLDDYQSEFVQLRPEEEWQRLDKC